MNRRTCLGLIGAAALLATAGVPAFAEWVPDQPVEIVVHGGPGSGNDLLARALSTMIDQAKLAPVRFTVSNRTGGGSTTASAYMLSKKGDPNVIGIFTSVWILDPMLQEEATTQLSDLTEIARLILEPALVVVKSDSPYASVADFINAAKAKPGELKQSGGSISARENIIRQMIMKETGTKWSFISFPSGGERLSALLGGHVDIMIVDPGEAVELVRGGQVKVLAQVGDARLPGFPDVPTLAEAGYPIKTFQQVRGVVGPPDMPAEAVAYYSDLLKKLTETPAWAKYIDDNYFVSGYQNPADTKAFLTDYQGQIKSLLTDAGVKVVR